MLVVMALSILKVRSATVQTCIHIYMMYASMHRCDPLAAALEHPRATTTVYSVRNKKASDLSCARKEGFVTCSTHL